jgi:hypothetical protein
VLGAVEASAKQAAQKTIQTPSTGSAGAGQAETPPDSFSGSSETSPTQTKSKAARPLSRWPSPARKVDPAPNSSPDKRATKAQSKQPAPDAGKPLKTAAAQNPKSAGTKPRAGVPGNPAEANSPVPKAKPHAARSKKPAAGVCEAPAQK